MAPVTKAHPSSYHIIIQIFALVSDKIKVSCFLSISFFIHPQKVADDACLSEFEKRYEKEFGCKEGSKYLRALAEWNKVRKLR